MTHICVSRLTIIGSDNGLPPGRRQAIIWTNAGILLIGSLGTNFHGILIEILTFSFKNMHLTRSSAKWRPFCLGLKVLMEFTKKTCNECTRRSYGSLCFVLLIRSVISNPTIYLAIFLRYASLIQGQSWQWPSCCKVDQWQLLLTWFNFNPGMYK